MPKFRAKPAVIEAVRVEEALRCASSSWKDLPQWLRAAYDAGLIVFADRYVAVAKRGEGNSVVREGDWIVCNAKGDVEPCRGEVFDAIYEPVEE
jgi:hypothetical protein